LWIMNPDFNRFDSNPESRIPKVFRDFHWEKDAASKLWLQICLIFKGLRVVENPGEGVPDVFLPKSQGEGGGGKASRKNYLGGPPISGFIAFLLTSVLKSAWGEYYTYPPLSPHLTPPPCASMIPVILGVYQILTNL
jgi:hypothetical protein